MDEQTNEPLTLDQIERSVQQLSSSASAEVALEVLEQTQALLERARELRKQAETQACGWIEANGDLVCGPIRYYVGVEKKTACRDVRAAVEAALAAVEGDLDAFSSLLSKNSLKHGACRQTLPPEVYGRLFITTEVERLKSGSAEPARKLMRRDERFTRR